MNHAYLLIGGNLGQREANLALAIELINQEAGEVILRSLLYETAAWGKTEQPDFLNQALLIRTNHSAPTLLRILLDIELEMGRIRKEKYGERLIDIDILFYNDQIVELDNLTIPHPQIAFRRFVLAPMAEIAANFTHPVLHQSIEQLLATCPDSLDVKKFSGITAV